MLSKSIAIQNSNPYKFNHQLQIESSVRFILIGIVFLSIHLIKTIIIGSHYGDLLTTIGWLALLSTCYVLSYFKRYHLFRIVSISGGTIFLFILHLTFGPQPDRESLYVLFILLSIFFFELRIAQYIALYIVALYLAASIYNILYPPIIIKETNVASTSIEYFLFVVLCIVFLTKQLILKFQKYSQSLIEVNRELDQKNQQLQEFNYILSHDLKEPIRNIVSFSQLIKSRGELAPPFNEFLNHVITSGQQLNSLVEDTILLQADYRGKLTKEPLQLATVIEHVKDILEKEIKEKGVIIDYKENPFFHSSKSLLILILHKIISNSIHYNNSTTPVINISTSVSDSQVSITIQDNGIGIEPEFKEKIFSRFKRLNAEKPKGSGLGLNIARRFAQQLNGDIQLVYSKPNEGSIFQLDFENSLPK